MAPVLTYLSEKTAEIMTGDKIHFNVLQLTRDILRASLIAPLVIDRCALGQPLFKDIVN